MFELRVAKCYPASRQGPQALHENKARESCAWILEARRSASCWSGLVLHDATQTTESSKQIPQRIDEALVSN